MSKIVTIQQLLEQKEQLKKKQKRKQRLFIESLDGEIVIQEPDRAIALEGVEMAQGDRADYADVHIAYHSVIDPNLRDPELQKAFGCSEPTDIVNLIFRAGEITAISGHALQLAGFGQGVRKVDETVKN
ncbi:phage tail assembly chaperone [Cohnella abietis]|uniref:Phage XkdN-like protein n=1 Tax=Cohnella abietis TaxID=2507935 RepID=A0A3T1D370_9BACL|nr:hypothetical protein [Cohnella abietis]BBI32488.1 hypothetical protein KCTCHS21_18870 [Cohnella abietis]